MAITDSKGHGKLPYVNQSMFNDSFDVNTRGGRFSIAGHPVDPHGIGTDNKPREGIPSRKLFLTHWSLIALLPVRQSMFEGSQDVITDGSAFDVVVGSRTISSRKGNGSDIGESVNWFRMHVQCPHRPDPDGEQKGVSRENTAQREQRTSTQRVSHKSAERRDKPPVWKP